MGMLDNLFKTPAQKEADRKKRMNDATGLMKQSIRTQKRDIARRERELDGVEREGKEAVRSGNMSRARRLLKQITNERRVIEKIDRATVAMEEIASKVMTGISYDVFAKSVNAIEELSEAAQHSDSVVDMERTVNGIYDRLAGIDDIWKDLSHREEEEIEEEGRLTDSERETLATWQDEVSHGEYKKRRQEEEDEISKRREEVDRLMEDAEKE